MDTHWHWHQVLTQSKGLGSGLTWIRTRLGTNLYWFGAWLDAFQYFHGTWLGSWLGLCLSSGLTRTHLSPCETWDLTCLDVGFVSLDLRLVGLYLGLDVGCLDSGLDRDCRTVPWDLTCHDLRLNQVLTWDLRAKTCNLENSDLVPPLQESHPCQIDSVV